MKLTRYLKKQGYDLIEGIQRNHKPLQLWIKQPNDKLELYYEQMDYAFESNILLTPQESSSLDINYSNKNEYKFNIGLTILENILNSIGITNLELASKITEGKNINISYNNSKIIQYPIGDIERYIINSDFHHPNRILLDHFNRDRIFLITSVVLAKNLKIDIETQKNITTDAAADIKNYIDGKLQVEYNNDTTISLISNTPDYYPIAVKAFQLIFENGTFIKTKLVTDSRNLFY